MVWYSHLLKSFPQFVMIHTVKGFGIVNKAEVDVFLELLFFLWSSRCWQFDVWLLAFSKSSLNIWKFTVHVLLKPGLENFEYYFTRVWDECNSVVVWAFFGFAFLWDWNEHWPFEHSLALPFFGIGMKTDLFSATAEFSTFAGILSAALLQHHLSGFEIAQLEFHHLH